MKRHPLLFSTGSLHLRETSECFRWAAQTGFDGIEVMVDQRYSTRDPLLLNRLSEENEIPILAVHNPFFHNLSDWPDGKDPRETIKKSVELAQQVGAKVVVVHLPLKVGSTLVVGPGIYRRGLLLKNPDKILYNWIKDGGFAAYQQTIDVKLCVENMPKRSIPLLMKDVIHWNSMEAWSQVHDFLTLDTTHWGTWGQQPIDALRTANGRVRHIHLSNFNGQEHQLPQDGHLDLGAVLSYVQETSDEISVSLESHPQALDYQDEGKILAKMRGVVAYCRQYLVE